MWKINEMHVVRGFLRFRVCRCMWGLIRSGLCRYKRENFCDEGAAGICGGLMKSGLYKYTRVDF